MNVDIRRGAGASAARFAADNGAKVLIVDRAPFGHEGGNTRYAAQHVVMGEDLDKLTDYYHQLSSPLSTPEKTLQAYVKGLNTIPEYFKKYLGINVVSWKHDVSPDDPNLDVKKTMAEYPEFPGSDTIDFALVHKRDKDSALWQLLRQNIMKRSESIDVWLNSRAKHLIQEPSTKAIQGVQIERGGQLYNVFAKNGVILATGGFENNISLIQTYLKFDKLTPIGTLYNEGDGINMAQEIGAKMWHMANFESHGALPGITFAEEPGERGRQINGWKLLNHGSIFVIADDGTRYFREDEHHRHGHINIHGSWLVPEHNEHPYIVFDQTQYDAFAAELKENGRLRYPQFMDKLISADSLEGLAQKMNVPAENFKQTVGDFNSFVQNGRDYAFNRPTETMRAWDDGPYYAILAAPDVLNTQGGPQRNENAQILDVNKEPIPHLYGAGELGGISNNLYQGGGNLAECLIFGKIAGENAAQPKDDIASEVNLRNKSHINDLVDGERLANVSVGENQYLGTSEEGMGGKITVRLTYADGRIQNVEVVQHHESEDIGLVAVDKIPEKIVDANSVDVDTISGASASSRAIKDAVKDALKKVKEKQLN